MSIGDVAADVGKGLFAGLAGTAAMTVSSTLEMKLSGRGASQTPAQAAARGLLASTGLPGPLDVSAPVFEYGGKATATDLLHHAVYATATGLAYSYLDRSQTR